MTKTCALIASTVCALAACGDNFRAAPDAGPVDAPTGPPRAVVVAGDTMKGGLGVLSTLDPATGVVRINVGPAMAVGTDPVLRHIGSELLIINRAENNITILDDQTLALKEQLGTGASSNPQDVAVLGDKLYVPTLNTAGVTVLTRGSTALAMIDLSADDPVDQTPDCNSVYLVGTELYVSCGRLDSTNNFIAEGLGLVHVIDTTTNAVKTTLMLSHKNPIGLFERVPGTGTNGGDLLIPTSEDFATAPGCVERVTPGTAPAAAGCLVDNAMLVDSMPPGGFASRIEPEVDNGVQIIWTAVSVTDFMHANLRAFDMSLSALWAGPLNPPSEVIVDVTHCPSGEVILVDSTKNANGLRIYNGATEKTTAALPIGKDLFSAHGLVCY
jgi:hypothetical protein